jgi:3-dehydroquinate synthase
MHPVIVKPGAVAELTKYPHPFLIFDESLEPPTIEPQFAVPQGETCKNIEVAQRCWEAMDRADIDREGVVIAYGGGATCDLAGFVAATYMRGVGVVQVPTSLLAMVDASIGGKVAINFAQKKNMIGAIHPPLVTLVDPELLKTLPEREMRSGMAEVIKIAAIADPELFVMLEGDFKLEEVIRRCIELKFEVIERERDLLNFGHTVGHALESLTGMPHGEAVAIGMAQMALGDRDRLIRLLERFELPTELPLPWEALEPLMRRDKKTLRGTIQYVVLERLGSARLVDEANLIERKAKQ